MIEKYISESKLKAHYSWLGKDATLSPKDVDDIVDAQPAADVEPVVRGEWIKHADGGTDENGYWHEAPYYVCSNCGRVVTSTTVRCHGCFAHMKRSDPRAATNQVDRCVTCDNNGKSICSSCIMAGHGNDIDFYRAAAEPKGEAKT